MRQMTQNETTPLRHDPFAAPSDAGFLRNGNEQGEDVDQSADDSDAEHREQTLRMGVSEMTRFGFGEKEFDQLAQLMAACILRGEDVSEDVSRLRAEYTTMRYCFDDKDFEDALEAFAGKIGF